MNNAKKKKINKFQIIALIILVPLILWGAKDLLRYQMLNRLMKVSFQNADGRASSAYYLERADTAAKQSLGLMFRKEMEKDRGMIFIYKADKDHSFWMKDTYIPLDMIFVTFDYKVAGVIENVPPLTESPRRIGTPARYVIELNAGEAAKNNIKPGTKVNGLR